VSELHPDLFQINDVVLTISPENITIDRTAQLKQYKPLRTRGTAKVRSPSSNVAITVQAKFVGIDDINNKLRPLVAQFLLTPFCYVENQYIRDVMLGNEGADQNMGLALINLTISTIENQPDTWNVIFSFIWFNYKPFTQNFKFKSELFTQSAQRSQSTPGVPFQLFYGHQLSKLRPVALQSSQLQFATMEFLIAAKSPNPGVGEDQTPDMDLISLRSFEDTSADLFGDIQDFVNELGTDSLEGISLRQTLTNFQSDINIVNTVQNTVKAISSLVSQIKAIKPNDSRLKDLIHKRDKLLQDSSLIFKGNVWLELPIDTVTAPNKFRSQKAKNEEFESKIYYKSRILSTSTDDLHSGLVATTVTMNFNHKLAVLPMQGYQYPTVQHLGSEDVSFAIQIACLDDDSNRVMSDFWNLTQNNIQYGKFIPQELTTVRVNNELFQFMGVDDILFSAKRDSTVPGQVGMYVHELEAVSNGPSALDLEQIEVIPTSFKITRKLVWKAIFDNLNWARRRTHDSFRAKQSIDVASQQFLTKLAQTSLISSSSNGLNVEFGNLIHELLDQKTLSLSDLFASKNIFLVTATLTDDTLLGADGINTVLWEFLRTDKTSIGEQFSFDKEQIATTREKLRSERLKLAKRQEALVALNSTIKDITARANQIDVVTEQGILFKDGSAISFNTIFPDSDIRKEFDFHVNTAIANVRAHRIADNLPADLSFDNENKIRQQSLISALREFESSLVKLNDIKSQSNNFDADLNRLFVDWNRYAVFTADEIINKYLNLPIFAEAKAEHDKLTQRTKKKSLYRDMSFRDIEAFIKMHLRLPDTELSLEPDFFFWNETADGGLLTSLTPENIEDVKRQTIDYATKIGEENSNWYQKLYLKKANPEFNEFLKQANSTGQLGQLDTDIQPVPGLSQITKDIDVSNKSVNATTRNITGEYSANTNQPGILPATSEGFFEQAVSLTKQPQSTEETLNADMTMAVGTNTQQSSYGAWIHPFPGAVITSRPGYRVINKLGAGFHQGTDLAYPKVNGQDMTTNRPVYSTLSGIVKVAGPISGGGTSVFIESQTDFGLMTHKYLHLSGILAGIVPGYSIGAGELLGFAGNTGTRSTGPHLHFECIIENQSPPTVIYPFGSNGGDKIISGIAGQPSRNIIVADLINAGQAQFAHLPHAGLEGLSGGLTAFEHSVRQLQASWNKEAGYRMNRAFPSIYLAFIEEDLDDAKIFKFDDYFSFSSIVSMYMVKDREVAADYTFMQLTNLSGMLSNRKFTGTFNEQNPVFNGKEAKDVDRADVTKIDTDEEYKFESLMLREGIKVEIRLGYSDNPDNLEVAFIGRIVGVQFAESDDLVELELQSLATELVQDIKGVDKVEVKDGLFVSDARTGPLLESMIASPECVSFGFWKRGQKETNTNLDLLTDRWRWNPAPSTDNIFAPPSDHLDPRKFLLGKSIVTKIIGGAAAIASVTAGLALSAGESIPAAAAIGISSIFGIPGTAIFGGAALGNTIKSLFNIASKGPFSALSYYIHQMTIWDVFKEMEHRHPDCIGSPVPYREQGRTRMTMFFGNPDWLYFARDPLGEETVKTQELKDRSKALKDALQSRFSKEDRLRALQEFADSTGLSDEAITLAPNLVEKITTNDLDDVFDDIDTFISRERLDTATREGSVRPFRRYHLVTSKQHIVANNIRAKSSNVFNTTTINYAASEDDTEKGDAANGPKISSNEELTMKLDPLIPDEFVREAVYTYPNCQGENMAVRYAVSHLQKSCWAIYQGDLVILGNPSIKPYDIVFIHDEYSDMYGPVQVRRITHMFDYEHGFISIITPDLLTTTTEGVALSHAHAMGLMAERFLDLENVVTPGTTPLDGVQTNPWKVALASGALGIASLFGMKKLLFVTQFGNPIRIHPLIKQGQAMVAGFGPPGVRENEFVINDVYEWFLTRSRAVADTWEDFKRMTDNREGLLNTRGNIFSKTSGILGFGDTTFFIDEVTGRGRNR
jgi:murein DD-endopeptidase MepM/ murein hydrolase activator NlpD